MSVNISPSEFSRVLNESGARMLKAEIDGHYGRFSHNLPRSGITSRDELAMLLANVLHESGCLQHVREHGTPTTYRHNGKDYYGRGYIQLTWNYNYQNASRALYGDDRLLNDPDMVASDLNVAWATTMWFWQSEVRRQFDGTFRSTIKAINSQELNDPNDSRAQNRYRLYEIIKRVLRV